MLKRKAVIYFDLKKEVPNEFFIFFGIYMEDHTTPARTVLKDKVQTLPIL